MTWKATGFWVVFALALLWAAIVELRLLFGVSYHPMAANGDLLRPLRHAVWVAPGVALVVAIWLRMRAKPMSNRTRLGLFGVLGLGASAAFFPMIDSGYREVHWQGSMRYDIPWNYAPSTGSPVPGGTAVSLDVAGADLTPRFQSNDRFFTIGLFDAQALDQSKAPCDYGVERVECRWVIHGTGYVLSGPPNAVPTDLDAAMGDVTALFDSFKFGAGETR